MSGVAGVYRRPVTGSPAITSALSFTSEARPGFDLMPLLSVEINLLVQSLLWCQVEGGGRVVPDS